MPTFTTDVPDGALHRARYHDDNHRPSWTRAGLGNVDMKLTAHADAGWLTIDTAETHERPAGARWSRKNTMLTMADYHARALRSWLVRVFGPTDEHAELHAALAELVYRCDRDEGVRADGSNIDTRRAHAILERIARAANPSEGGNDASAV